MSQPKILDNKWGKPAMTHTVEFYHAAVRRLVAEKFAASGKTWEEAVEDPSLELTKADFEKLEQELLATGYRFEMSAQISIVEEPEKYKAAAGIGNSGQQGSDEQGRLIVGTGDNVFQATDIVGIARFVGTVDVVMDLDGLADGDQISVEFSKPAADAYAERNDAARARIVKIS